MKRSSIPVVLEKRVVVHDRAWFPVTRGSRREHAGYLRSQMFHGCGVAGMSDCATLRLCVNLVQFVSRNLKGTRFAKPQRSAKVVKSDTRQHTITPLLVFIASLRRSNGCEKIQTFFEL
jgi:hypothetical protein